MGKPRIVFCVEVSNLFYMPSLCLQLMACGGVSLMFFIGNVIEWRSLALIGNCFSLVMSDMV